MLSQVALRTLAPVALVALCLAGTALPAPARATVFLSSVDQGSWTTADKQLHFAGSLAIASSIRVTGKSEAQSFTAAVSVGVIKELYDATIKPTRKKGASWKDLAADILGAAAGVLLLRAME